jgi:hypothetical protein
MLRNGAVFAGRISHHHGRYVVKVDDRTQMSFDPLQVWAVADEILDLYEYRRTRIKADDTPGRMGLVRWCVTQNLIPQAEQELQNLHGRQVPAQQLHSLELLVANARQPIQRAAPGRVAEGRKVERPAATQASVGRTATSGAMLPAVPQGSRPVAAPLPPPAARVVGAPTVGMSSAQNVAGQNPGLDPSLRLPSAAMDPATPVVNSVFSFYDQPGFQNDPRVQAELDNRVQQTVVNAFSDSVHWTLVQSCAGCHYPENRRLQEVSGFALEIPSSQHKATNQQTRHNLEQLLTLVQRDRPADSRLLGLLQQPHGPLTEPPIDPQSPEWEAVTRWILSLDQTHGMAQQRGEWNDRDGSRVVPAGAEVAGSAAGSVTGEADREPSGQPLGWTPGPASAATESLAIELGGPEVDPLRPYDPRAFNRHYHPMRSQRGVLGTSPLPGSAAQDTGGTGDTGGAVLTDSATSGAERPVSSPEFQPPVGLPRIRKPVPPAASDSSSPGPSGQGG